MRVTVLAADFAQTEPTGKIHAIGLAWNTVGTPLPAHGVVLIIEVDWHEANEQRVFALELLDEDGHPVAFDEEGSAGVRVEGTFEVGRPPGLAKGTPLLQTFAVNFPAGMPLQPGRRYEYRATVGEVEGSATFSVSQPIV